MMSPDHFLHFACQTAVILILGAMLITLLRLIKGPTAADRVISLDLLSVLVVAFLVGISVQTRETSYLDVAIAYACIAFLGTIALARFILRSRPQDKDPERRDFQDD